MEEVSAYGGQEAIEQAADALDKAVRCAPALGAAGP
jgi:hypothetical protein